MISQINMAKSAINLSSSGLKNLVLQNEENQFTFKIGNKSIRMHQIYAEFLSPAVSHIHHCDPTINSMTLNFPQSDEYLTDEIISQIQKISSGYSVEIEQKDSSIFRNLSLFFGNEELHRKIDELFPIEFSKLTTEELIKELKIYEKYSKFNDANFYSKIIEYIADKFESMDKQKLKQLSKPILYSILTSDKLKIENEDALKDFIDDVFDFSSSSLNEENVDIVYFYEILDFSKLSLNKLSDVLDKIEIDKMTSTFWDKCKFIITRNNSSSNAKNKQKNENDLVIEFDGQENNRLKGIINYLSEKAGGNIYEKGIVDLTASSIATNIKYLVDLNQNIYQSHNLPNQWVKYDFKEKKIQITHYTIYTRNDNCDGGNPQNWVLEGSNSNKENDWVILDSRQNEISTQKANKKVTFEIKNHENNESFRFIRFRQTGKSSNNNDYLTLTSLEFFGTLVK